MNTLSQSIAELDEQIKRNQETQNRLRKLMKKYPNASPAPGLPGSFYVDNLLQPNKARVLVTMGGLSCCNVRLCEDFNGNMMISKKFISLRSNDIANLLANFFATPSGKQEILERLHKAL